MDSRVWHRYVAVACGQAMDLDVHATEELVGCIEALAAVAPATGSAAVKIFAGAGVGEVMIDEGNDRGRVRIRLMAESESGRSSSRLSPVAGERDVHKQNRPVLPGEHGLLTER